jgi:multicomponent Na+:H+ antiporter subunit E
MLLAVGAVAVLFAFWLLLSGYFTAFLVSAGLGCAVATVLFSSRMKVIDSEGIALHSVPRLIPYWIWLLKEIVKSAWQVSLLIVHPRLPISPTLVSFRPTQKTSVGLVIHANSITLTPGTITVEAEPGQFLVHALTRDAAAGAASGDMDARVTTAFEGRA